MQSILMAVSDLIASILNKMSPPKQEETKSVAPIGYRPLFFHCWLCTGVVKFACKNSVGNRKFTIDCSWCGVENAVTVPPSRK